MNTFTAIEIAEGLQIPESEEQAIEAWQYLIDTGLAWQRCKVGSVAPPLT
jgi:hypothetical protein